MFPNTSWCVFVFLKNLLGKQGLKTYSCEWVVFRWSLRSLPLKIFHPLKIFLTLCTSQPLKCDVSEWVTTISKSLSCYSQLKICISDDNSSNVFKMKFFLWNNPRYSLWSVSSEMLKLTSLPSKPLDFTTNLAVSNACIFIFVLFSLYVHNSYYII